jgi:DNA-binding transcriptional ArsR family regulator
VKLATGGEASVNEIAEPFAMSQPAISKHLRVLEGAGLISRCRDAQRRLSRLEAKPLAEATAWLARYRGFWKGSHLRLAAQLGGTDGKPSRRVRARRRKGGR